MTIFLVVTFPLGDVHLGDVGVEDMWVGKYAGVKCMAGSSPDGICPDGSFLGREHQYISEAIHPGITFQ